MEAALILTADGGNLSDRAEYEYECGIFDCRYINMWSRLHSILWSERIQTDPPAERWSRKSAVSNERAADVSYEKEMCFIFKVIGSSALQLVKRSTWGFTFLENVPPRSHLSDSWSKSVDLHSTGGQCGCCMLGNNLNVESRGLVSDVMWR